MSDTEAVTFNEVTSDRWPDLERLFAARGGPKACWCMVLRDTVATSEGKRAAMRDRVLAGTPVGILAYRGDDPIGWCSVAPKSTFGRLGKDAGISPPDANGVWSITCFFVPRTERGHGLLAQLLDAAVHVAQRHGARLVEAYPVDPDSPSYRFGGFVQNFERAGFEEAGLLGTRRHVMRRA